MAYTAEFDLFSDQTNDLHKKVARAISIAVVAVLNEDPGTADHIERLEWARGLRASGPDALLPEAHRWMLRILENSDIQSGGNASPDNDVQFVINGLVTTMAQGISGT
jgi:hypothetical protein